MPVKKGKLKPDDEKRLTKNYEFLIEEIDAAFFVSNLFSKEVFTEDDKEEISHQPSRSKRTQMMLDKLLNSGPGDAYNIFLDILKRDYPHVVKKLNETHVDQADSASPDYSWLDEIPDEVKKRMITDADASRISRCFDANWMHVITRLGVHQNVIDQERQNYPYGSITNVITVLLIKWRQRFFKNATVEALLNVLKEVDKDQICTINWETVNNALVKNGR